MWVSNGGSGQPLSARNFGEHRHGVLLRRKHVVKWKLALLSAASLAVVSVTGTANASSHMDAPGITQDDPANTTDVYAFISKDLEGEQYLTVALAVYPFEEPGIGPNAYQFDDEVRYAIHIALDDGVEKGQPALSYEFDFATSFVNEDTILQSYLGIVTPAGRGEFPDNLNRQQVYSVRKVDHRTRLSTMLGRGQRDGLVVPPNNQGLVTPFYNENNDGNLPVQSGAENFDELDPYTQNAIAELPKGYLAFAGQRDDGFYADIQSIFDLDFSFGTAPGTETDAKPFDSQGGFNLHTIVLNIPLAELEVPRRHKWRVKHNGSKTAATPQLAGVYATTSRPRFPRFQKFRKHDGPSRASSKTFVQVGRQGNPLFAEALLPLRFKDRYNQTPPTEDFKFVDAVDDPELSRVLGVSPIIDLRTIYTPDLIRVDLTTGPARLAGGEDGFNRLSVFGGDVLQSQFQDPFGNGGLIPGGWPNGRRFGDDVVDIAVIALGAAGPLGTDFSGVSIDRVDDNDVEPQPTFPYATPPQNGRNHE